MSVQFLCDQIRRQASGIVISKTMYRYQNLRFFCNIYNTDVGIKRSKIRHDQQMKPVQAGRRNTQGERNMTNKPIYIKIYDKIKSAIKGGTYPPGSFLPTEQELETLYQVSRTTIRKAVKLLSDEGILSVRQGCGTMVMDTRTTQNYNQVTSVTESLQKRGHDVTTGSMMIDDATGIQGYCHRPFDTRRNACCPHPAFTAGRRQACDFNGKLY